MRPRSLRRTTLTIITVIALIVLGTSSTFAQRFPEADPADVGLSAERLALATQALQRHIDAGDIAGVVAAVVRDGKLVYHEALGQQDLEIGRPMRKDSIFRLYSMSRPVTSLAALMLSEEGALGLDDPVEKYLPEFERPSVFVDPDAPSVDRTRQARSVMSVTDLIRFTSGLHSRNSAPYRDASVRSRAISLEQFVRNVAGVPLMDEPGTRWRYGVATTVLGRVIEVVSGQTLEAFLEERVFRPLGFTDMAFWVPPESHDRLVTVYRPSDDGELRPVQLETVPFTERPALLEGGIGLVSNTVDYLRFSQLFLNGGELDGTRLLGPEALALMTTNQVPDVALPIGFGRPMLGAGWSLGFCVVLDGAAYDYPMTDGEYWWDGSAGTRFWIDPGRNMITIVMAQVSPARGNGFREEFKSLVYAAIDE